MGSEDIGPSGRHRRGRAPRWLLAVGLAGGLLAGACSGDSANLVAAAETFDAPAEWRELSQSEVNDTLCFGPDCTTIVVRWQTGERPDAALLRQAAEAAGWSEVSVDDCEPAPNVTGPVPFCELNAAGADADVVIRVAGPVPGAEPWQITLLVS